MTTLPKPRHHIEYPESDGEPIADNTIQFRWIVTIKENLEDLFRDDPNVFIAGDLLWYPVEGNNKLSTAPDTMVVFGRPKGDRGSYLQWQEGNISPQVVFEILSPRNRTGEMTRKFQFYDVHGVEEYYLYDPADNTLDGWLRQDGRLKPIEPVQGWVSPRLKIRFEINDDQFLIFRPNGAAFRTVAEFIQEGEDERQARIQAQARADAAQAEAKAAQAEAEAAQAKARAAQAKTKAAQDHAKALEAKLRAMGINPDSI